MNESTFRRCNGCGGPTEFSPSTQALVCPFCRATQAIAPLPRVGDQPIETVADARAVRDAGLRTATCSNCGATAEVPATTAATHCAFCTHPLTVDPSTVSRVPADNVVPFRVDKSGAASAFTSWLGGLWFRPNDLKTAARLDRIRGVYVPSWIFSAHARSNWTAESGYHYYETEWVEVNGKKEQRQVQKTRWQPSSGHHEQSYRDVIVEASKGLEEPELTALEPYDLATAMVGYRDDYLAGFEAECLSSTAGAAWTHGAARVASSEQAACSREVPGDTHRNLAVQTQTSLVRAASTLVPVYVAAYIYRDVVYRLLVNGQTAKVVGKAPWSAVKIALAVVATLLVIVAIVLATRR